MHEAMAQAESEEDSACQPAQPHRSGAAAAFGAVIAPRQFLQPSRRTVLRRLCRRRGGFRGARRQRWWSPSFRNNEEQTIADEVVSAHIRSLQAGHLMDVETSDQHTVKPWFNGKLDVAPPVIDLTAEGFTLLGGRLDYIDGEPVASVVYRRRKHVINLFVAQRLGRCPRRGKIRDDPGLQCPPLDAQGLDFWAVSDLAADELDEFTQKISAALRPSPAS